MAAEARTLPDGRLHLHHGPIDLVIGADGTPGAIAAALDAATLRFAPCWTSWWPNCLPCARQTPCR
ncbi:hypothetical protein ACFSHQ_04285 [Gemmobacter lanyuensis]